MRAMPFPAAALLAAILVIPGRLPPGAPRTAADSAERARVLHALNRMTFGPRPGDLDRVAAMGLDRFIDQQLHPEHLSDRALDDRLKGFEILHKSPRDL